MQPIHASVIPTIKRVFYLNFWALICLYGCEAGKEMPHKLETGIWRTRLLVDATHELPFNFDLNLDNGKYVVVIHNDTERLQLDEIEVFGDSVRIRMPFFDAEFLGEIESPTKFSGNWYNYSRGDDYYMPFVANYGESFRFDSYRDAPGPTLAPSWQVTFSPNSDSAFQAIGKFEQKGDRVTGTVLTETGDARFLEGTFQSNRLQLSAFDGSHAYLFDANLLEDGQLKGTFYSGNHWKQPWIATPDDQASLRHPDSLTFLRPGYEKLSFEFPNLNKESVSLNDEKYKDKVVIVQIMGSWCPNCMDETRLYTQWYDTYNEHGLEIIGLAFERVRGKWDRAVTNVSRMKKRLDVNYEVLIAALDDDKQSAGEHLPMLNHIISYPTSIFIDRKGKVRKIHTGFSGPGTGNIYVRYVEEYTDFLEKLLAEE